MPDVKNPIRCVGCNKIIAEGLIKIGEIKIQCRCGTVTEIKAQQKDSTVYDGVIKIISDK